MCSCTTYLEIRTLEFFLIDFKRYPCLCLDANCRSELRTCRKQVALADTWTLPYYTCTLRYYTRTLPYAAVSLYYTHSLWRKRFVGLQSNEASLSSHYTTLNMQQIDIKSVEYASTYERQNNGIRRYDRTVQKHRHLSDVFLTKAVH